jgi:hypothetical protein
MGVRAETAAIRPIVKFPVLPCRAAFSSSNANCLARRKKRVLIGCRAVPSRSTRVGC